MAVIVCEKLNMLLRQLFLERLVIIVMGLKNILKACFQKNPENMKLQVLMPK